MLTVKADPEDLSCGHEYLTFAELQAKVKEGAETPSAVGFFCPHGFSIARLTIYNMEAFKSLLSPEVIAALGIEEKTND
jgi:hypothetical protein